MVTKACIQNFKTLGKPFLENLGEDCCCCWSSSSYHVKVKSTPRFGLGWEFDKNTIEIQIKI
jgi:hypothetical protein